MEIVDKNMKKIGTRIRKYRIENDMNMKLFADKMGISIPYLSQIENGKININVSFLYKVVKILGLSSITNLLTDFPESDINLTRKEDRESIMLTDEIRQYSLCLENKSQLEVSILNIPGECNTGKPSQHQGEEVCYVLEGTIKVIFNAGMEEYILRQGDAIEYPSWIPHCFKNISKKEAEILIAGSPARY